MSFWRAEFKADGFFVRNSLAEFDNLTWAQYQWAQAPPLEGLCSKLSIEFHGSKLEGFATNSEEWIADLKNIPLGFKMLDG